MQSPRFRPPSVVLLSGGGILLLGLLLLLTWKGVQEESGQTPSPSPTPLPASTPDTSGSRRDRDSPVGEVPAENPPMPTPVTEAPPAPEETPEPVPSLPSATVPAVFGAAGNAILSNVPYAPGLEDIANDFIEKVKQGGWDTTSEAYKKNWEKAAEEADNMVRARYGTEVYLRLKHEAAP